MRKIGMMLIVILLLPCVITVFVKGVQIVNGKENFFQRGNEARYVKTADGESVYWEDYLLGSLAVNISADMQPETLKAQMVLLRSQADMALRNVEAVDGTYLSAEEMKALWMGEEFRERMELFQRVMEETRREVLYYGEGIAVVAFHERSAGMTRAGAEALGSEEFPYLQSVDCSADKDARGEMEVHTFSYEAVWEDCKGFLRAVDTGAENHADGEETSEEADGKDSENDDSGLSYDDFEVIKMDLAGYVTEIRIAGDVYPGEEFRQALHLPSSAFTLQDYKGKLRITTMGSGHGLGMSQYTANEMAKSGASYKEILEYFFPGTELKKDDEIFSELE